MLWQTSLLINLCQICDSFFLINAISIFFYFSTMLNFLNHKIMHAHHTTSNNAEVYKENINNPPSPTALRSLMLTIPCVSFQSSLWTYINICTQNDLFFPLFYIQMGAYSFLQDELLGLVIRNQRVLTFLRLLRYKFLSYQISFQKDCSSLYPCQKCGANLSSLPSFESHIFKALLIWSWKMV